VYQAAMSRLLLDTCVLIDHLRAQPPAVAYIRGLPAEPLLSAVTIAEIYAGVRNPAEARRVEALVDAFLVLAVDAEIARRGGSFRRQFARSHGTGLLDALIAATAEAHGARLVTCNARHFPMLADLLVPYS
jgi:predicted nucleic acid-binding protein